MPNENLTTATKKAMTASETSEVMLHLLELSYDGNAIVRIVDNTESITSNGKEYIPCAFTVLLPDQTADGMKSCRLQIDNTDLSVYRTIKEFALRAQTEKKKIACSISVIMASESDNIIEGPFSFSLRNIVSTVQSISGEMYDSYMSDMKYTNITYCPQDFPGMFW